MSARSGAPPGRRSRPVTQPAGSNVVEVTTTDRASVDDQAGEPEQVHCWLCPLPRCGFDGCRVDAEAVAS